MSYVGVQQLRLTKLLQEIDVPSHIDLSKIKTKNLNWNEEYISSSLGLVPNDLQESQNLEIPFVFQLQPFAEHLNNVGTVKEEKEEEKQKIEYPYLIDPQDDEGIPRCSGCKSFVNVFTNFFKQGLNWKCNLCGRINETPEGYYCKLDNKTNLRTDRPQRIEFNNLVYEMKKKTIKKNKDRVSNFNNLNLSNNNNNNNNKNKNNSNNNKNKSNIRNRPAFLFVIDVSNSANRTTVLESICKILLKLIQNPPKDHPIWNNPNLLIGFITFDDQIHVYQFKKERKRPHMIVVSDFENIISPHPSGTLFSLTENQNQIVDWLKNFPKFFSKNRNASFKNNTIPCLTKALMFSKNVLKRNGGKMILFCSTIPEINTGINPLILNRNKKADTNNNNRNNNSNNKKNSNSKAKSNINKNDNNSQNKQDGSSTWLTKYSFDCSDLQISIDLFICTDQLIQVNKANFLTRNTSGRLFVYDDFSKNIMKNKVFQNDFKTVLTQNRAWYSFMRIICDSGTQIKNVYGNYLVNTSKLIKCPNITPSDSFLIKLERKEKLLSDAACFIQVIIYYTHFSGERRIRVINKCLLATNEIYQVFLNVNLNLIFNYYIRSQIEKKVDNSTFINFNKDVKHNCVRIIKQFYATELGKKLLLSTINQSQNATFNLPQSLELLPFFTNSLTKNNLFLTDSFLTIQKRNYYYSYFQSQSAFQTTTFLSPFFYDLSNLRIESEKKWIFPARLSLTKTNLKSDGVFLITNGLELFMYVGKDVKQSLLIQIFGKDQLLNLNKNEITIPKLMSVYNKIIRLIIKTICHSLKRNPVPAIIWGGEQLQDYFFSWLIEDPTQNELSYHQFRNQLFHDFFKW
ncbi:sec24-related protein [Anaeramoeba flamelloides]|uniref:Sec24-related protein n=1 Tax=Anaeramoeba flamelloides TaxID=1746091 RepID=A0AAV7YLA4_9EUKA|nr:sec24-related protein [Anaeramoeba flamelloides]